MRTHLGKGEREHGKALGGSKEDEKAADGGKVDERASESGRVEERASDSDGGGVHNVWKHDVLCLQVASTWTGKFLKSM